MGNYFTAAGASALCALLASASVGHADNVTVLYTFQGSSDGGNPVGNLIADRAGNFYGTTTIGGASCTLNSTFGCGVVFKLAPGGIETALYAFTGGSDGALPSGGLNGDIKGNLYGAAFEGGYFGTNCPYGSYGCGTFFKVSSTGNFAALHAFETTTGDGFAPRGGVTKGAGGHHFGITQFGGVTTCGNSFGCGTVYGIAKDGTESVLYAFQGGATDGYGPLAAPVADTAGNLYGTTDGGGAHGCGTVYRLLTNGNEAPLYSFTCGSDGGLPESGLLIDGEANLFGTTGYGGDPTCLCGTLFRLSSNGVLTVLYTFLGGTDGAYPTGPIKDAGGNYYGTTVYGGASCSLSSYGCGTVFKLDPNGNETVLHAFTGGSDGALPFGTLLKKGGYVYGMTFEGGISGGCGGVGCGTVFKVPVK